MGGGKKEGGKGKGKGKGAEANESPSSVMESAAPAPEPAAAGSPTGDDFLDRLQAAEARDKTQKQQEGAVAAVAG